MNHPIIYYMGVFVLFASIGWVASARKDIEGDSQMVGLGFGLIGLVLILAGAFAK